MKASSIFALPATLQDFYRIVKTLKANEAHKEGTKVEALTGLTSFLAGDTSVLIVTKRGLAVCDINPQAHVTPIDPTDDSPEIKAVLKADEAVKTARAKLAIATAAAKAAGKIKVTTSNSIRMEILNADKTADMLGKYGTEIKQIRKEGGVLPIK